MKHALLRSTALALLTCVAWPQNLTHVRLDSPVAPDLARSLEAQGYDILEGSVRLDALELVVSDVERAELEDLGFALDVIQLGRPFREIQAERGEGTPERPGYPDLDSILATLNATEASFPAICEVVDLTARYGLPPTHEGRNMYALRISDNVGVEEDEPSFLLVSAHHCRETVTPLIALEAISQLTSQYGVNSEITQVVDDNDIWIAPVWNPDGYEYVFDVNNNWRKNRRPVGGSIGIDLNRNYPFGWNAPCSGSSNPSSNTYKGPSAASEAETQTMIALSNDQRFAKVIDFHSSGQEILWEYACNLHPLAAFLQSDGIKISTAAGYGGANRPPSAEGEHYEWQLAAFSSWSYLLETATAFQPPIATAQAEAVQVWSGIFGMLRRAIPVSGNVTDACSGAPLEAEITFGSFAFSNGESAASGGPFGRYDVFLPSGPEMLTFSAPGYQSETISVTVFENAPVVMDVALDPDPVAVVTRSGGSNPLSYTAPQIQLGTSWTPTVDNNVAGQSTSSVFAFDTATLVTLGGGQAVLALDAGGSGELLTGSGLAPASSAGGIDSYSLPIPPDPSLCGLELFSQAIQFGTPPFVLSNAQDLKVGP